LNTGLLEKHDVDLAGDEFRRHELAVDLVGVDEEARGRVTQDGVAILVVKPVIELVAAGQAAQDRSVRLFDVNRDIAQVGGLNKAGAHEDKDEAETE